MNTAHIDQYEAAEAEMGRMVRRALGPVEPDSSGTPWTEALLTLAVSEGARCEHLERTPIQPAAMVIYDGRWRCVPCGAAWAEAQHQAGYPDISDVENHTCDRCRQLVDGELTPLLIRCGMWVMTGAICGRCERGERSAGRPPRRAADAPPARTPPKRRRKPKSKR